MSNSRALNQVRGEVLQPLMQSMQLHEWNNDNKNGELTTIGCYEGAYGVAQSRMERN